MSPVDSLPLEALPTDVRRALARLVRAGLPDAFAGAPPARREALADELRQALERTVGLLPAATPAAKAQAHDAAAALAGALAAVVETGDRLPLLRLLDAETPPPPAPLELLVTSPTDLAAQEPARWAVIFRRTMGSQRDVVVRPRIDAGAAEGGVTTLRLTDWPPDEAFNHLPADMGGPYRFAVGFVAALGPGGHPVAWAPDVRVLALDGPFPVDAPAPGVGAAAPGEAGGLRAFVEEHPPPPDEVSPEELEGHLRALASLPAGLQLAAVVRPSRSLLGMAPRPADAGPVEVSPGVWPPAVF